MRPITCRTQARIASDKDYRTRRLNDAHLKDKPPAEFIRDVEGLITLLANPRMPGNYGDMVAGASS